MPYTIRKVKNQDCYKVTNKLTKKVYSKCTTKEKAQKQLRLLRAIDHNPKFVPKTKTQKTRKSRKTSLI